jgi:hypothetical protein
LQVVVLVQAVVRQGGECQKKGGGALISSVIAVALLVITLPVVLVVVGVIVVGIVVGGLMWDGGGSEERMGVGVVRSKDARAAGSAIFGCVTV